MKTLPIIILFSLLTLKGFPQAPQFVSPIDGTYGQDFIIVNYVDWAVQGILDHECGSKTYDGHQGTDFVLKSFPQMDAGVAVLAVDTGIVIATIDGVFDRETVSDPAKGLGNYIGLKHNGDLYTYYGHLKINSLLVEVGGTVLPGQKIAEVASSGNSSDPHLHFELWYDSLTLIDPYAGDCGNPGTYWLDPLPYDDSYGLWESGLTNIVPTLDELKERPEEKTTFYVGVDSVISFWTLQYGLLDGDVSQIQWYTPDNDLWYSWNLIYVQDWWYHYFWSNIDMPPIGLEGTWKVVYSVNGQIEDEISFEVSAPVSIGEKKEAKEKLYYSDGNIYVNFENSKASTCTLEVYDLSGKKLTSENLSNQNQSIFNMRFLEPGIYFAVLVEDGIFRKGIKFIVY